MLFCQFYGHVTTAVAAAAAVGVCVCVFSLRFVFDFLWSRVCIKTAQYFQNELIRKLNIYDLSKWKINYLHPTPSTCSAFGRNTA